jgi:hypothetical protein
MMARNSGLCQRSTAGAYPHLSEMLTTIMMQGIRRTKVRDVERILEWRLVRKPIR